MSFTEESLVINIEKFLDINRSSLPPCNVCGGISNGFHYGVFTCEACKTFFRRGIKKHHLYKCKGRKNCSPDQDSVFACRYCRFQKCVSVGMSLSIIKHGRYSRQKKTLTDERIAEVIGKKTMYPTPRLLNFTDSDEMLIGCCNILSDIQNINWDKDFPHFESMFENVQKGLCSVSYPLEQYYDILNLSGLEVDNRNQFFQSIEQLVDFNVKRWIELSKRVPGMSDLTDDQLFQHLGMFSDIIYVTVLGLKIHHWDTEHLTVTVNNRRILVNHQCINFLFDKREIGLKLRLFERLCQLNPTFEELTLIIMLSLLRPTPKYPHFRIPYNKIVLAFTRYTQNTYGNDFVGRMGDIINFISFVNLETFGAKKWRPGVSNIYQGFQASDIFKNFWSCPPPAEKPIKTSTVPNVADIFLEDF